MGTVVQNLGGVAVVRLASASLLAARKMRFNVAISSLKKLR